MGFKAINSFWTDAETTSQINLPAGILNSTRALRNTFRFPPSHGFPDRLLDIDHRMSLVVHKVYFNLAPDEERCKMARIRDRPTARGERRPVDQRRRVR